MEGATENAMNISITPDSPVGDIVIADPAAARVFERHRIDYCCQGRRTLAEACAAVELPLDAVIHELERLDTTLGETAPIDDVAALMGHIVVTHHTYLRRELPRLGQLMDKVVAAHGAAHPEVLRIAELLSELTDDLLPHLAEEEQVLFSPTIQLLGAVEPAALHCRSVLDPIGVMTAEHDDAGELLASIRHHAEDYVAPDDACPTWRALWAGLADLEADTHRHVHLENNVLFPAIAALERDLAGSSLGEDH